jgi:hypothetical protein
LLSGGIAGAATAVAFTALHQLLISDIWFSVVPMMVAGVLCGLCLAWTYVLSFDSASPRTWFQYIGVQALLLLALGAASMAMFDPVVSVAVLIAANEPPRELIAQAMPLTVGFTLLAGCVTSLLWGRTPLKFGSNLLTSAVLIFLLGLNVSVLGLVEMTGAAYAVAEFLALLMAIMSGYAATFFVLERRALFQSASPDHPSEVPV